MRITNPKKRREGDTRPFKTKGRLKLFPTAGEKFRWLPRQGEPICVTEWVSQIFARFVTWLPVYTAIIVTLAFLTQVYWHWK